MLKKLFYIILEPSHVNGKNNFMNITFEKNYFTFFWNQVM